MKKAIPFTFLVAFLCMSFAQKSPETSKGNSVYIESDAPDDFIAEKYLSKKLGRMKFWNVVTAREQADFIIQLEVTPVGHAIVGFGILKTPNGQEITRTGSVKIRSHPPHTFDNLRHEELADNLIKDLKNLGFFKH